MRSINPSEHQIQCAIVDWANKTKIPHFGKYGDFLLAIPNGGNRSITEAIRLKKEGVKKGVSDLFFAYPRHFNDSMHGACGLWLEVKSKKGVLSKEQKEWIKLMNNMGYCAVVVKGVDEGIQAIKNYLGVM